MEWISVNEKLPEPLCEDKSTSVFVLITDGDLIEIGRYIFKPRTFGCAIDDDESVHSCGPQPHWHPEPDGNCFKEGDMCFGRIEIFEITHWMPLIPPPNVESAD